MATKTVKFTANTTFQNAASGPLEMDLSPERGFFEMYISTTSPYSGNTTNLVPAAANTFLLKPVAGENYLNVVLSAGDSMWLRTLRDTNPISWVQK